MSLPRIVMAASAGYLIGTLPSASVAARIASGGEVDIHAAGTGNPGAANAMTVLGTKWGLGVMAADIAKGAVACSVGGRLAGPAGRHIAGPAAVIGHCFPVWSGFRGGKGVATSVGQVMNTFPAYFPVDLAVAAATAGGAGKDRARSATTIASVAWVAGALLWWRRGLPNLWGPKPGLGMTLSAAVSSAVILGRFAQGARS